MAGQLNRDKRNQKFDVGGCHQYNDLIKQREEKAQRLKPNANPFLICSLLSEAAQPHQDKGLYEDLYKFNVNRELHEFLAPLDLDASKKKKITKFDILMLNPKQLNMRKAVIQEEQARLKEIKDRQHQHLRKQHENENKEQEEGDEAFDGRAASPR